MHHHRSLASRSAVHIGEIEAQRQLEVHLYGRDTPVAPRGVADLHVDLRSVEGGLTRRLHKGQAGIDERLAQQRLGDLPVGRLAEIGPAVAAQRQPELRRGEAERRV